MLENIKAEVTNVETKVESAVAAVEAEVKQEVATVVAEEKKYATETRIEITDAENLLLTKMENQFLKIQMDIRRLNEEAKSISENFPKKVAELMKKYAINEATHVFNALEGAFIKK